MGTHSVCVRRVETQAIPLGVSASRQAACGDALSAGARVLSLGVLRGMADVEAPEAPLELRTVAVSPTEGALRGPVLPTAQADPEA